MHELAICQSLLASVEQTVRSHKAQAASKVTVSIGPLSGIEPPLLKRAWTIARAGTLAQNALLTISVTPLIVKCSACGHEGHAQANRLICEHCSDWRVTLLSGDEMLLSSVELDETCYMEGTS